MRGTPLDNALLKRLAACLTEQIDKPEETAESTLKALYFAAAGEPLSVREAMKTPLPTLSGEAEEKLFSLVEERCAGVPLAHITGRQQFMGIEMLAGPEALIPRIETEILGFEALAMARMLSRERGPLSIMDLCTGSGNIILGMMAYEPQHRGYASDISDQAVKLAKRNASHLNLGEKVKFFQGDLFEPFEAGEFLNSVDLITCNPPYISSKKASALQDQVYQHEPPLAFDGGPFGLTVLTRLIHETPKFLKPRSFLCFEVGLGQGPFVTRMLDKSGLYREIRSMTDGDGQVRAFTARI
jgi:release factor glutamine methyltransferase